MAKYEVQGPGGEVYDIEAPDDADPSMIVSQLGAKPTEQKSQYNPATGGGTLQFGPLDTGIAIPEGAQNFLAGAGKSFADVGRGAKQLAVRAGEATGILPAGGTEKLQAQEAEQRRLDAPLTETKAGKAGQILGGVAATAPLALIPGANSVAGAALIGGGSGALQPTVSGKERLLNIGLGGAVGGAAQFGGAKLAQFGANKLAARKLAYQGKPGTKATDDLGNPTRVFRGSTSGSQAPRGGFFSDKPEVANSYSRSTPQDLQNLQKYDPELESLGTDRPTSYPGYLDMRNPLVIDAKGERFTRVPVPPEFKQLGETATTDTIGKFAKAKGYDGVVFKNLVDDMNGNLAPSNVYQSFKPSQFASQADDVAAVAGRKALETEKRAQLDEFRKAELVVPVATTNPTLLNRTLESVSGKAATQQSASVKNTVKFNELVRDELSLPQGATLNKATLQKIREGEGKVYAAVSNTGPVKTGPEYLDDLIKIQQGAETVGKDFPELNIGANKQIQSLVDGLAKDQFDAKSAVEAIKQLRNEAAGNLSFAAAADPSKRALGNAQRDAAAAVEDELKRHLERTGNGSLAKQFDAARTRIAKTYSVQAALNPATGNVIPAQLGNQLKKGKPLSGNLDLIARFAQSFPKAAEEVRTSPGVSALDAFGAAAGSAVSPALLGLPVARIGTRNFLLSNIGQKLGRPNYAPGKLGTAALKVAKAGKYATLPAISANSAEQ